MNTRVNMLSTEPCTERGKRNHLAAGSVRCRGLSTCCRCVFVNSAQRSGAPLQANKHKNTTQTLQPLIVTKALCVIK